MPLTVHQLENELFNLDLNTRGHLAKILILSIDTPTEAENLKLWVDEVEHRLADLRAGKAQEYSANEVLQGVGASLRQ